MTRLILENQIAIMRALTALMLETHSDTHEGVDRLASIMLILGVRADESEAALRAWPMDEREPQ